MTVSSVKEAWSKANEIFPGDYMHDSDCSNRAGYNIYWSTTQGLNAWISDLNDRLEVNLPSGESINIWINEEVEENNAAAVTEEKVAEMVKASNAVKSAHVNISALYTPEVCQRVTIAITGGAPYVSEEEQAIYNAIGAGHPTILFDIITEYAERNGIKWGSIFGVKSDHYDHTGSGSGHYIVSGYISGRIGEEMSFCSSCVELLNKRHEEHKPQNY